MPVDTKINSYHQNQKKIIPLQQNTPMSTTQLLKPKANRTASKNHQKLSPIKAQLSPEKQANKETTIKRKNFKIQKIQIFGNRRTKDKLKDVKKKKKKKKKYLNQTTIEQPLISTVFENKQFENLDEEQQLLFRSTFISPKNQQELLSAKLRNLKSKNEITSAGIKNKNVSFQQKIKIVQSASLKKRKIKHMKVPKAKRPQNNINKRRRLSLSPKNQQLKKNFLKSKTSQSVYRHYSHPYFQQLVRGPSVSCEEYDKFCHYLYQGLSYSIRCLRGASKSYIESKAVFFEQHKNHNLRYKKSKSLILDLDETLIHSCDGHCSHKRRYAKNEKNSKDILIKCKVLDFSFKLRPYLMEFLQNMSQKYEIIIFTASTQYYADAIINHIDPENKYISYVLTRKHCMQTKNGFFIKDLRIIKNRELKDMVIVDNLLHSFGLQIDNGIPILEFIDNQHDQELVYLQQYLNELYNQDDFRKHNKEQLKLRKLLFVSNSNTSESTGDNEDKQDN